MNLQSDQNVETDLAYEIERAFIQLGEPSTEPERNETLATSTVELHLWNYGVYGMQN